MRYENRNLVRRELIYYLKVANRQTNLELGRLGDIHIEGLRLFTLEPLPEQTVYELCLELPKALAEREGYSEVPFQAQARWNRPSPKPGNYHENGLRFLELTSQAHQAIQYLTEILAMPGREVRGSKFWRRFSSNTVNSSLSRRNYHGIPTPARWCRLKF
jgi:hypothetical protein